MGDTMVSRRWLLGSAAVGTAAALIPSDARLYTFESRAEDGRGSALAGDGRITVSPAPARTVVGQNLTGVSDYSGDYAFLDRMKTARPFGLADNATATATDPGYALDADGWPDKLSPGIIGTVATIQGHGHDEVVPTRRFVILHDGRATFQFTFARVVSSSSRRMVVELDTVPGTPNYWILSARWSGGAAPRYQVVREDHEALLKAGHVHPPCFLKRVAETPGPLRFMDWGATNSNARSEWDQRTRPGHVTYNCLEGGQHVPYEVMIALCNQVGRDCYLCVPYAASDAYVEALATLARVTLRPDLKLHLEYGNEIWNWQFPGTGYLEKAGRAEAAALDWHWMQAGGYRAAQVAKIADRVFRATGARARLRNVWGCWTGWLAIMNQKEAGATWAGSDALPGTGVAKLSDVFDEAVGTNYFDGNTGSGGATPETRAKLLTWARSNDYASLFQQMRSGDLLPVPGGGADLGTLPGLLALVDKFVAYANGQGLVPCCYEGGLGMLPAPELAGADRDDWVAFALRAVNRPEVEGLTRDVYRGCAQRGVAYMCNFVMVAQHSRFGTWGALEYTEQPDTPRWRALVEAGAHAGAAAA